MAEWFVMQLVVLVVLLLLTVFGSNTRRFADPAIAPRNKKRPSLLTWVIIAVALIYFVRSQNVILMSIVLWGCLVTLWQWLLSPTTTACDAAWNYHFDATHCGRCGYDLTGSVSTVCTECGWPIPVEECLEHPDWQCWWKKWGISYLADWRESMRRHATALITIVPLLMLGLFDPKRFPAGLIAWMLINEGINMVRILRYGRRTRKLAAVSSE